MGTQLAHYKIAFREDDSAKFIFDLFSKFKQYKFPEELNSENFFSHNLTEINYFKLKHEFAYA